MRPDFRVKLPKVRMLEVRARSMSSVFQGGRVVVAILSMWIVRCGLVVGFWDGVHFLDVDGK